MVGRAGVERKWPVPKKTDIEMAKEYELLLEWCQKHASDAFKPWTVCQHPDLGEVGGLDMKFTLQNPPAQFLKEEIEKTTRFCLRMTKTLPQLTFDHIQVSPVGKDTYCIDVYIANKGYLPTYLTDETKKMAIETPIKVEMSSTQAMIHSNPCVDLGQLEGFSGIKTGYGFDGSISTQNHAPLMKKATYYVVGKPGDSICVKATHPKAGTVETTIVLE